MSADTGQLLRRRDTALRTTASTWIAPVCWYEGSSHANTAHHPVSLQTRLAYGLDTQLVMSAGPKAVEAIKAVKAKHRKTWPSVVPRGHVRYDAHTWLSVAGARRRFRMQ